jgi:hypothetical protein
MIKIDMEMRDNCDDCRFLLHINNKATCYASVSLHEIDDIEVKPTWCPLIECEDEIF